MLAGGIDRTFYKQQKRSGAGLEGILDPQDSTALPVSFWLPSRGGIELIPRRRRVRETDRPYLKAKKAKAIAEAEGGWEGVLGRPAGVEARARET